MAAITAKRPTAAQSLQHPWLQDFFQRTWPVDFHGCWDDQMTSGHTWSDENAFQHATHESRQESLTLLPEITQVSGQWTGILPLQLVPPSLPQQTQTEAPAQSTMNLLQLSGETQHTTRPPFNSTLTAVTVSQELLDEVEATDIAYGDGSLGRAEEDIDAYILSLPEQTVSLRLQFPPDYPAAPPGVVGTTGARNLAVTDVFRRVVGKKLSAWQGVPLRCRRGAQACAGGGGSDPQRITLLC